MDKAKRTITVIVCLLIIVGGTFTLVCPEALIRYKKDTDFEYTQEDGGIVLTKYNGSAVNLLVPSSIDSKPVKAIRGAFCDNETLKNVKIGEGVEVIDYMAFYGCTSLVGVELSSTVKKIEHAAFWGCVSLERVKLGDSLEEIMPYAFSNCLFLREIKLPDGLLFIGENAFMKCVSLKKLTIPASVEVIGGITQGKGENIIDQRGSTAHTSFDGCEELKLKIEENNNWYKIENGEIVKKGN